MIDFYRDYGIGMEYATILAVVKFFLRRFAMMWHLIPTEVRHELQYEIARHELEYADNYRAYRVRDNFLFDDWSTAYHQGCCGSFDTVITLKNGEKWIVGCNYGH